MHLCHDNCEWVASVNRIDMTQLVWCPDLCVTSQFAMLQTPLPLAGFNPASITMPQKTHVMGANVFRCPACFGAQLVSVPRLVCNWF